LLPPSPATVLDVGGGAGIHAGWLAEQGYRVHLIDPVPLHVEQAMETSAGMAHGFTAAVGDARRLDASDASQDAVLLLGPLYHLTERPDRLKALDEARRVLRPGGSVLAVGISRFASLLDGLHRNMLGNPEFAGFEEIVAQDLRDGQHRNPDPDNRFGWFTTAFFHHPDELGAELTEAGFALDGIYGIEGPGGLWPEAWADRARRPAILAAVRAVEQERTLLGVGSHLLAVGTKSLG
jgi:SAM-dependent methyltransferase